MKDGPELRLSSRGGGRGRISHREETKRPVRLSIDRRIYPATRSDIRYVDRLRAASGRNASDRPYSVEEFQRHVGRYIQSAAGSYPAALTY